MMGTTDGNEKLKVPIWYFGLELLALWRMIGIEVQEERCPVKPGMTILKSGHDGDKSV